MSGLLLNLSENIVLAVCTASISLCFNHFLRPGMIFNWYAKWLIDMKTYANLNFMYAKKIRHKRIRTMCFLKFCISRIVNPLGLCVFCHGTWLAIITYFVYHSEFVEINVNKFFSLFLFIGLNWLFIFIGKTRLFEDNN